MDYDGVKARRVMGFGVQSPKIKLRINLSKSEIILLFWKAKLDASCEKLHFNDEIRVLTFCNCCCCSYHWFPFWTLRRKSTKYWKIGKLSDVTNYYTTCFDFWWNWEYLCRFGTKTDTIWRKFANFVYNFTKPPFEFRNFVFEKNIWKETGKKRFDKFFIIKPNLL